MQSDNAVRSILKQPTANSIQNITDEEKAKAAQDRRNLGIALFHANKIQSQKDATAHILSIIETLLELPSNKLPTDAEATRFAQLVEPFQPSDFDDLVEERRSEGKCGYALCVQAPRSVSLGSSAAWKLASKAAGDYCSSSCMKKALYVRTQLIETPVWEREPGQQPRVVLHQDDRPAVPSSVLRGATQRRVADRDELAMERGDQALSLRPQQVMADSIVEKTVASFTPAIEPTAATSHTNIEGYEPKRNVVRANRLQTESDSSEDEQRPDGVTEPARYDPPSIEDRDAEDSWRHLYSNLQGQADG